MRGPGRAAVCRADEKQIEYKSLRTRRELATTLAWVLSRGIEMAKWRKPKTEKVAEENAENKKIRRNRLVHPIMHLKTSALRSKECTTLTLYLSPIVAHSRILLSMQPQELKGLFELVNDRAGYISRKQSRGDYGWSMMAGCWNREIKATIDPMSSMLFRYYRFYH